MCHIKVVPHPALPFFGYIHYIQRLYCVFSFHSYMVISIKGLYWPYLFKGYLSRGYKLCPRRICPKGKASGGYNYVLGVSVYGVHVLEGLYCPRTVRGNLSDT